MIHFKSPALALMAIMVPTAIFAAPVYRENLSVQIMTISICNWLLFATSLISIIQFFRRDGRNHTLFQLFNIFFAVAFYSISLTFLVAHKDYFEGFENLSNKNAVIKYFMDRDAIDNLKLLIPVAIVFNLVYILRFSRDYYLE